MIGIQIFAILFAIWMIYFSYLHYKRNEFSKKEFVFWQLLWIGLIIVVIYPSSVRFLLDAFKINRTFDLVVIVGMVVLFAVTFRNYVLLTRNEKKIQKLVTTESLKEIEPKK